MLLLPTIERCAPLTAYVTTQLGASIVAGRISGGCGYFVLGPIRSYESGVPLSFQVLLYKGGVALREMSLMNGTYPG